MKKTQIAAFSYDGDGVSFEITDPEEAMKVVGADPEDDPEDVVDDIGLSLMSFALADAMTRIITKRGYDITKVKQQVFGGILRTAAVMLEEMGAPYEDALEFDRLAARELEEIICLYGDTEDLHIAANCEKLIDPLKIDGDSSSETLPMATIKALANAIAVVTQQAIDSTGMPEEVLTAAITAVPEALNREMDGVEIGTFFGKTEKELYDRALDDEEKKGFVS